jgi:outer membrane protein assembly factor BamB
MAQDWWMFHANEEHTGGAAAGSSGIVSHNVAALRLHKQIPVDFDIISIPTIVMGKLYVGTQSKSSGGSLYRIDLASGSIEKQFSVPFAGGGNWGSGIGGSPAVTGGRVYFAALDGKVYCLDANSFSPIWTTPTNLRNPDPNHHQPVDNSNPGVACWTSPLVVKGNVYVGVGLGEDGPGAAFGFLYCLDAATGNVKWLFCTNKFGDVTNNSPNDIPNSLLNYLPPNTPPPPPFTRHASDPPSRGASVWSPPAYDSVTNCIFFGTGNPSPDGPLPNAPYSSGAIGLNADTGAFHGFFQPTAADSYRPKDDDVDVPSGPTVFTRGQDRVVGIGSKNGFYALLDPHTVTLRGGRQLLPYKNDDPNQPLPGVDPDAAAGVGEDHSGIYGSAAVHPGLGYLFVGLGGWGGSIDSTSTPFLRALKWDNSLADAWQTHVGNDGVRRYTVPKPPMYTTPKELVAGSAAVVNDVVLVPTNKPGLYGLDAADGTLRWSAPGLPTGLPGNTEVYIVGPAVSGGYVAVGCQNAVYIYSLPMSAAGSWVASWGLNRLDIFGIGMDGAAYHKAWNGAAWLPSPTGWDSLGGVFTSPPTAVAWGLNRLDIFGIGLDGGMYHKAWDGTAWRPSPTGWDSLGGVFSSPPAVASWGYNRLDLFGIGLNGAMYHKAWNGTAWLPSPTGWESLGGVFSSPPAVVSWGLNRLDIFGLGLDGAMYHKAWNGTAWLPSPTGWDSLGGVFTSPPAVVSWGENRLDIFGIGMDGAMYHKAWNGSAWLPSLTGWDSLGGVFSSLPAVASWGYNRLDIFGLGMDGAAYHKAWNGSAWLPSPTGWDSLGGVFSSPPAVVSWGQNRLDIFGIGMNGAMYHKAWNGSAWLPSPTGWDDLGGVFEAP